MTDLPQNTTEWLWSALRGKPARLIRTQGLIMIWLVAALHAAWGGMLLYAPESHKATPTYEIHIWLGRGAGPFLLLVAALAFLAVHLAARRPTLQMVLAAPQQAALILSALGTLRPITAGIYPDGTVVTSAHIFVDQSVYLCIAAMHLVALIGPRAYSLATVPPHVP